MSDSNSNQAQKASLARIRDNQRRSRARRKEYLQELETKNRVCEAIGVEASAEIQAAARRVLDENTRLRQLLKQHGLSDADIDGFSTSSASSPSSNRSDVPDKSHFPAPSTTLDSLLQSRKQCTPGSGCGNSHREEAQSLQIRAPRAPSQTRQCSTTPASRPPSRQPQQQQQQHINIQPAPPLSPQTSPDSRMSASASHEPYQTQATSSQQIPDYPLYDPQPHRAYMYPLHLDNTSQWSMPGIPQPEVTQAQPFEAYSAGEHTTSCYIAADAIRAYSGSAGLEVEHALGCHDGSECHVDNSVVFELMDHYDATANNNAPTESIP